MHLLITPAGGLTAQVKVCSKEREVRLVGFCYFTLYVYRNLTYLERKKKNIEIRVVISTRNTTYQSKGTEFD